MPELRTVEVLLEEWWDAQRELANAPEEQWLAILAIMDQLYTDYLGALNDREALTMEIRGE